MTILHVIPAIAPRYGGPSRAVLKMCGALRRRGIDARLATTDADGPARLDIPHGEETDYFGIPTMCFSRVGGEGFKFSLGLAQWLRSGVRAADVVHIHAVFSHVSLAAARACVRASVPYVLSPHGTLDPWGLERKRLQKRFLLWAAARKAIGRAATVHFTTAAERQAAERTLGPIRGVVIPFGVEESLFREPPLEMDQRRGRVLVLARLDPVKNLESLIDAFADVVLDPRFSEWRLQIAGDGEAAYSAALRARAQDSGAGGQIDFLGWIDGAPKIALLREAAVLAQPSHLESFGMSIIEALALGVPVIVTPNVNLSGDIERAGAGWVAGADRAALSRSLFEAMSSSEARQRRSDAARALGARFTWTSIAEALEALYSTFVGQSSRAAYSTPTLT